MESPFKILIDSRNASEGHGGQFSYQLPEVVQVPKNFVCYVSQASVTNSFLSTGTFVGTENNRFYWFERIANNDTVFNTASLPNANYDAESLATALQTNMNLTSWFGNSPYTVTYNQSKNAFDVAIPFDNVHSSFIPDDSLMQLPAFQAQTNPRTAGYASWTPNWDNLSSCHGLLGLGKRSSAGKSLSEFLTLLAAPQLNSLQQTGSIDIRRLHNVYLRSQALSSLNHIGIPQSHTLLCKIPVTNQFGDILSRYHNGAVHDYVACANRSLSTLDFFIADYDGNSVDLRGGTLSLELLFCPQPF